MRLVTRIVFGWLILCACSLADGPPSPYMEGMYTADILVGDLISTGRQVVVAAATDYVEILSVRLKHKPRETVFNVLLRFQTRDIAGARIEVSLFDESGHRVGHIIHTEAVGPEVTRSKYAKGLHLEHRWDDPRSVWIEVPRLAERATMFTLAVWPKTP